MSRSNTSARRKPLLHPAESATLELDGGVVQYWPHYLGPNAARQLVDLLQSSTHIQWRHDDIVMFGRRVSQPRLTAWIADPGVTYRYSGLTLEPQPWPRSLAALRDRLAADIESRFNSVLANRYRDGDDSMGWHRDNEAELGSEPVIASLSLGESRYFDLRHRRYRDNGLPVQRFELQSGDLLVMRGATQQNWHHRVPKQKSRSGNRINLSFRHTKAGARSRD